MHERSRQTSEAKQGTTRSKQEAATCSEYVTETSDPHRAQSECDEPHLEVNRDERPPTQRQTTNQRGQGSPRREHTREKLLMAIWGLVTGFLGKFSIKQYIYGAIAIMALTLGLKMWNGVQSHLAEDNNLKEANLELREQKTALIAEKKSNEVLVEALTTALETQAEAINIVNGEFAEAREEAERQKRVLEGSRLGRIAAERAAIIEGQSNKATTERMKEIEGVINEDF